GAAGGRPAEKKEPWGLGISSSRAPISQHPWGVRGYTTKGETVSTQKGVPRSVFRLPPFLAAVERPITLGGRETFTFARRRCRPMRRLYQRLASSSQHRASSRQHRAASANVA